MGVIKGLAAIQQEMAKRPSGGGDFEDKPKAKYVNVPDGKSVKMIVLQEIDEGSPNFKSELGTAIFVLMHSNPDNWQKSGKCTVDLGSCYGCDQKWKQKVLLYVNVLVDDGSEAPYVAIFNKGIGKGSVAGDLIAMAGDDDFDLSITDKTFKLSRKGLKTDTTYSLAALPKPHGKDLTEYKDELYDLEKYVFTVAPERQEAYYLDGQAPAESGVSTQEVRRTAAAGSVSVDAEW